MGQALIDKTPALTARAMELVQGQLQSLLPKMQAEIAQAMDDAKRAK